MRLIIDLDLYPAILLIRYKESLAVGDLCVDRRIRVRLCADIDAVRVGDRHQLCNLKRFVLRLLSCQDILRFYITGNVSGTDLVPADVEVSRISQPALLGSFAMIFALLLIRMSRTFMVLTHWIHRDYHKGLRPSVSYPA